jgi:hypothetical protein
MVAFDFEPVQKPGKICPQGAPGKLPAALLQFIQRGRHGCLDFSRAIATKTAVHFY